MPATRSLNRIRCLVSTGRPSNSNSWTENSFSVRRRAGMFTGNMGTRGLVEEALWLKIQMKCRWVTEAARDGVLPLPDDTHAARLLVFVVFLQRCLSPSPDSRCWCTVVSQRHLRWRSMPQLSDIIRNKWEIRGGGELRTVKNVGLRCNFVELLPFKQGDPTCNSFGPYYGHDFVHVSLSSVGRNSKVEVCAPCPH